MVKVINPKLKAYASYDPTKVTKQLSITELCEKIDEGSLVLPIFQTYLRWTKQKAVELFNYQLMGKAPVAPISVNLIKNPSNVVKQIAFIDRKLISEDDIEGKESVADGQQRISTNYRAYKNDPEFNDIVLDVVDGEFIIVNKINNYQIPVGILYNEDDDVFFNYVDDNKFLSSREVKNTLLLIRQKFQKYYYILNYAQDLNKEEQMEWFDVLNLAGSRVTGVMVHLTDMLEKGVDFYVEYAIPFGKKLDAVGLGHLFIRKTTEVSIPLAALNAAYEVFKGKERSNNFSPIPSDEKSELLGKCENEEIRRIFNITLTALDTTLNFISSIKDDITRIDIITYLIGVFVYNDVNNFTDETKQELIAWVKDVNFTNQSNTQRREEYSRLLKKFKQE
ncbi:GmrSD restriction endonuclease domain-containing protein [Peribacillus sp. NPDC097895]|uniref:GmrSD restriction endonuclease domain-containing protein n=1 Tax=Peribacillus sp. NPDC097895 TaxID=3390619 RepID=UPI003D0882B5